MRRLRELATEQPCSQQSFILRRERIIDNIIVYSLATLGFATGICWLSVCIIHEMRNNQGR